MDDDAVSYKGKNIFFQTRNQTYCVFFTNVHLFLDFLLCVCLMFLALGPRLYSLCFLIIVTVDFESCLTTLIQNISSKMQDYKP
jgi:hypothetical protein